MRHFSDMSRKIKASRWAPRPRGVIRYSSKDAMLTLVFGQTYETLRSRFGVEVAKNVEDTHSPHLANQNLAFRSLMGHRSMSCSWDKKSSFFSLLSRYLPSPLGCPTEAIEDVFIKGSAVKATGRYLHVATIEQLSFNHIHQLEFLHLRPDSSVIMDMEDVYLTRARYKDPEFLIEDTDECEWIHTAIA